MAKVQERAFVEVDGQHEVEFSALPDCIIPHFLAPEDVTRFVKRAIAHKQVLTRFIRASEADVDSGSYSGISGLASSVARQGYDTAVEALDLLTPATNPDIDNWHSAIESLASLATAQDIDFSFEINL